jgi:hypothetical protein
MVTGQQPRRWGPALALLAAPGASLVLLLLAVGAQPAGGRTPLALAAHNPPSAPVTSLPGTATPTPGVLGCWSIVPSPNPGGNLYNRLKAVGGSSGADVWAVGQYIGGGVLTLVEHWNGSAWAVVPSANIAGADNVFNAVAASGPDDAWAVGKSEVSGSLTSQILIEHWNGSQWNIVAGQDPAAALSELNGVAARAPNDVWAVGYAGAGPLVEHWNGSQWSIVPSPGRGQTSGLKAVTALAANDAWAVGTDFTGTRYETLIEHWNGSQWTIVASPNPNWNNPELDAVAAIAADDVWAVGGNFDSTLAMHWDGQQWTIVPSPNPGGLRNQFTGVAGRAASDVWAVGYADHDALIEHWDGANWRPITTPYLDTWPYLTGVVVFAPLDAWAVGTGGEHTLMEHYATFCPTATPTSTATPTVPTATPTATVTGTPPTATPSPTPTNTWPPPTTTCCYASGSATTACTLPDTYSYDVTLTNATPYCVIGVCGPVDIDFQVASDPDPFGRWTTIDQIFAGNVCLGNARFQGSFYAPAIPPPNIYYRIAWHMAYTNCLGPWYSDGYSDAAVICPGPPATSTTPPLPTQTPGGPSATPPPSGTPRPTRTPGGPSATPPPPTATSCAVRFSDVHPADYFYQPVLYLACRAVISGYGDGTFRPYTNTTRAQMVKIVVLGFAMPIYTPPAGQYTFADVPPSQPFFAVIETAAHSIVSGYDCGGAGEPCDAQRRPYFRPGSNVTRGQLSKIVVGAASWPLLDPATATFVDVVPGSAFYAFVETAVCHRVVTGYADGTFRPGAPATRGQIGKIVYLALTPPPGSCAGAPLR